MKIHHIFSHQEGQPIGKIYVEDDYQLIRMMLEPEFAVKYRGLISVVVPNIIARGQFKATFDKESLEVTQASELFWMALIQTFYLSLELLVRPIDAADKADPSES